MENTVILILIIFLISQYVDCDFIVELHNDVLN